MPDRKKVQQIKKDFPQGTRIEMVRMNDPHAPVQKGMRGTVNFVDDAGQVHMKWDDGRTLAINLELDQIEILSGFAAPEILFDQFHISVNESDIVSLFKEVGLPPSLDNLDILAQKNIALLLEPKLKAAALHQLKFLLEDLKSEHIFKEDAADD